MPFDHISATHPVNPGLLIAALLSAASVHAADNSIVIAPEDGKQTASFKLNGSVCVLKNDHIRCAPVSK